MLTPKIKKIIIYVCLQLYRNLTPLSRNRYIILLKRVAPQLATDPKAR
jgi:hypothetical protein